MLSTGLSSEVLLFKKKNLYSPSPHGVYSLMKVSVVEQVQEFLLL